MIAQTPFTLTCLLNSQTESIAGSLAPFSGNLQRVLPGVRLETDDCRAQLQHGVCVCVCVCARVTKERNSCLALKNVFGRKRSAFKVCLFFFPPLHSFLNEHSCMRCKLFKSNCHPLLQTHLWVIQLAITKKSRPLYWRKAVFQMLVESPQLSFII